jgi:hypothetical protein
MLDETGSAKTRRRQRRARAPPFPGDRAHGRSRQASEPNRQSCRPWRTADCWRLLSDCRRSSDWRYHHLLPLTGLPIDDGHGLGAALTRRGCNRRRTAGRTVVSVLTLGGRVSGFRPGGHLGFLRHHCAVKIDRPATIGSPPNGSSPTIAHSTNTPRKIASAAATTREICGGPRPSGVLGSSAVIDWSLSHPLEILDGFASRRINRGRSSTGVEWAGRRDSEP